MQLRIISFLQNRIDSYTLFSVLFWHLHRAGKEKSCKVYLQQIIQKSMEVKSTLISAHLSFSLSSPLVTSSIFVIFSLWQKTGNSPSFKKNKTAGWVWPDVGMMDIYSSGWSYLQTHRMEITLCFCRMCFQDRFSGWWLQLNNICCITLLQIDLG